MKPWQSILLGFFFGLISAGAIFIIASQPRGEPIQLLPSATVSSIRVYITGAINNPAVYSISPSSRVEDVIQQAGGLSENADLNAINMADTLIDGQKIVVPEVSLSANSSNSISVSQGTKGTLININSASQNELNSLPGIGDSKALDIIKYREQYGLFSKIEDIQKVPGIGPGIFEKIKLLISVK